MTLSHSPHFTDAGTEERHPMQDLLDAEAGYRRQERGDVVTGVIAMVGENEILIDIGAKYEGILSAREFMALSNKERRSFVVGDDVECVVVNPEDRNGYVVLSINQARMGQDWDDAERLFSEGTVFEASVSGHNKGGLIVYVGQVRGFIPASQIDRRHGVDRANVDGSAESPLAGLVTQSVSVKVIEIDRRKNRLILSEQLAMREARRQSKVELLEQLQEGQEVQGVVTSLADFGAFVDIGGADGLVHLSELAWNRVSHPREVLKLGQEVTVKVISVDREKKRIGLSLKQLQPEPWSDLAERFPVGRVVSGTITRIVDFGAFARLESDIEGLIHLSEISDDGLPIDQLVQPGEVHQVRIIRVDPERRRIGLSLKRADPSYDDQSTPEALAAIDAGLDFEDAEPARNGKAKSKRAPAPTPPAAEAPEPVDAPDAVNAPDPVDAPDSVDVDAAIADAPTAADHPTSDAMPPETVHADTVHADSVEAETPTEPGHEEAPLGAILEETPKAGEHVPVGS